MGRKKYEICEISIFYNFQDISENNVKSHLYWNNMGYKNLVGNSVLHRDAEHYKQQHDSMIQQEFEWEW